MKNILVTSAGRRVSLVEAFRKELRQVFPDAKVFAADQDTRRAAACQIADEAFTVPAIRKGDYAERVLELCSEHEIGLVVPTIDTELLTLAEHSERFLKTGTQVAVPGVEFIQKCRDKRLIHDFFRERDIDVPAFLDRNNLSFPVFIKPLDGSSSKDNYLIEDPSMLSPALLAQENLLFMEAIDRRIYDEFTVDLYYNRNNQLCCVVPRKRLEVRGGEVSKGVTIKNEIIAFARERLDRIEGVIGCVTAQFFKHRDEPRFYGIEINPRFGGGYPLSYLAGANFPRWLIEEYFLDRKVEYTDDWEENLLMLRYDSEVLVHGHTDHT